MSDDNVVDIFSRQPHAAGPAVCLECRHEWVATVPVGVASFECPSCKIFKGVFKGFLETEEYYVCDCNSPFFSLTKYGPMCVKCGTYHADYLDEE